MLLASIIFVILLWAVCYVYHFNKDYEEKSVTITMTGLIVVMIADLLIALLL